MGEVVKARALGPHGFEKVVAIKRIRAEWAQQETMAQRFIREARIAARLQHANIVQVFDFGRHGDELFIVMEFVDGQSLDDILAGLAANGKRPTLSQTLQIALDVTRALDSAHHLEDEDGKLEGIIHRDVSPANVLISRQGVVKLVDFGIAAFAAQQGRTSLVAGKPMYMAPEQLRGDPLDPRCDLFAVGLLVYEMLTGQRPWKGMVDPAPGATLDSMGYQPPSKFATEIPPEVDAMVTRLLAPDREQRFASAAELAKEIVKVSYACHIVLDPSELRPLIGDGKADAHAPTQPSHPSKLETLVATVSPDGLTMLAPGTGDRIAEPTLWEKTRSSGVMPVAAILLVLGVGGIAFAVLGGGPDEAAPIASIEHRPPPDDGAGEAAGTPEPAEAPPEAAPEPTPPDMPSGVEPPTPDPSQELADPESAAPAPDEPGHAAAARRRRAHANGNGSPAPAPAAPSGEPGFLDVWSNPWSRIYVDGQLQPHNAPHRGLEVPSGRHVVRLVNPELGLSHQETVVVPPGGRALVRAELRPDG